VYSHITKQINNEIVCQLYLDIPTQATTPATQCKRHILHVEARVWPFNGQTVRNQTKPSTPLYSPFDFGAHRRSDIITNGSPRRITSDHEILPAIVVLVLPAHQNIHSRSLVTWGLQPD
jgi:hypothetical protein